MARVLGAGGCRDKDVREGKEGWANKGALGPEISAPTETQGRELKTSEAASAPQLRKFSKESVLAAAPPSAPLPFPGGNCCGVEGRGRRRKAEEEEGEDEAGGGEKGGCGLHSPSEASALS